MSIDDIAKRCKASVHLDINDHRTEYMSVSEYLAREDNITEEECQHLLAGECIYRLQFYPDTPIGFYVVWGTSVEQVAMKADKILKAEGK